MFYFFTQLYKLYDGDLFSIYKMIKTIKYKLVLYYDSVIDENNTSLITETITFDKECDALNWGINAKNNNVHMFEVFAETEYYKNNNYITDKVNTVRYVNFKPVNNKNIL